MSKISNAILFEHVQRFIREVFKDRLRQAGFCSYRNEDIHWFRLVNNEVIHAVYFVTDYLGFPTMLEIGYACHPLFIQPVFQRSPYMHPITSYEQIYHVIPELIPGSMPYGVQRSTIHGLTNKIYRVPDIMVSCPTEDQTSLDILEKVLSVLDSVQTPAACFEIHKHWRSRQIENDSWLTMSPFFVDEVLYWDEKSLFSYCMNYINGKLALLEKAKNDGRYYRKVDQEEYQKLLALRSAFSDEARIEYIQDLQKRACKNFQLLEKWTLLASDD